MTDYISTFGGAIAYPAAFTTSEAGLQVAFVDLPEVGGVLANPEGAEKLLSTEIARLLAAKLRVPAPSKERASSQRNGPSYERMVAVPTTLALKALLWDTMCAQGEGVDDLAAKLGCSKQEAARLLDPHTESRSRLADALAAYGRQVAVTIVDTGPPARSLGVPGQPGQSPTFASTAMASIDDVSRVLAARYKNFSEVVQALVLVGPPPTEEQAAKLGDYFKKKTDPAVFALGQNAKPVVHADFLRSLALHGREFDLYRRREDSSWERRQVTI